MKIKILHFFFFIILCSNLFAQAEFAPAGAEWCYRYVNPEGEVEAYFGIEFIKDTLVPPWNAKLLRGRSISPNNSSSNTLQVFEGDYLYFERNDSVFFIYGTGSVEYPLFNKQYQRLDTVVSYIFDADFIVDEIDSTTFNNKNIKITSAKATFYPDLELKIYGHIGPNLGFTQAWWTSPLGDNLFDLAAYKDDLIGTVPLQNSGSSCFAFLDYEPPQRTNPDTCQLVLFPNPVTHLLQLKLDCNNIKTRDFDLTIQDASGKLWIHQAITFSEQYELPVAQLPSGQYFGRLKNERENYSIQFTKIE